MRSAISSLSANALLAKARAMYADVLTKDNYTELAACRTVSEAASYLKAHTAYGEAFSGLSNVKLHRARLEAVLKKYMLGRLADLFAYEKALGQTLYSIFLLRSDIECILTCADFLDTDSIGDYLLYIPDFFKLHTEIDTVPLERARTAAELCEALRGTRYGTLVEPFLGGKMPFSVQTLENILYDYLYTQAKKIVSENFKGKEREEILDFFRMRADAKMLESICRLKTYYYQDSAIPNGSFFHAALSSFSPQEIQAMLHAETAEEVLRLVRKTRYGKYLPEGNDIIERKTHTMQLRINERNLRFSTCPQVVLLSFVGIIENEMHNVTHIIEGVRYALGPEEMLQYLVLSEDGV